MYGYSRYKDSLMYVFSAAVRQKLDNNEVILMLMLWVELWKWNIAYQVIHVLNYLICLHFWVAFKNESLLCLFFPFYSGVVCLISLLLLNNLHSIIVKNDRSITVIYVMVSCILYYFKLWFPIQITYSTN